MGVMITATIFIYLIILCLSVSLSKGDGLLRGILGQEQEEDENNSRSLRRKFDERSYRCASSRIEANHMSGEQCQNVTKYCISAQSGSALECGFGYRCMNTPFCPFAQLLIITKPASYPVYKCTKSDDEIQNDMCDQFIDCYNESIQSKDDRLCTRASGTKCLLAPNCSTNDDDDRH